jgi:hypothetical protein
MLLHSEEEKTGDNQKRCGVMNSVDPSKNARNYFVLQINALEDNFNLFEFINDKRFQRATVHRKITTSVWYRIKADSVTYFDALSIEADGSKRIYDTTTARQP